MAIRLVVADDHPVVLEGLVSIFQSNPKFEVSARCVDGEETLEAVRSYRPDVLILDLRMPRLNGLEVLESMRRENYPTATVLLTAQLDEGELFQAVSLGVHGIVLKEEAPRDLVRCIEEVHAGKSWLEGRVAPTLADRPAPLEQILTGREIDVARQVAVGKRNREIASELGITEGTIKLHLHNIYEKLGLEGRLELALLIRSSISAGAQLDRRK
jgi:DNA-binding NarL/FixJ family response regulator